MALFDGLVEKRPANLLIDEMRACQQPEDYFVFFDRNHLYQFSDQIAEMPFHGNFPTEADYLFERNRDPAKQLVREHYPRLHVPDVKPFNDVLEALEFLKSTEQLWVLKGREARFVLETIQRQARSLATAKRMSSTIFMLSMKVSSVRVAR